MNALEFAKMWYENQDRHPDYLAEAIDKYFVPRPKPKATQTEQQMAITILSKVTGLDWKIKRNVGRLAKVGKELRDAGYTIEQVRKYYDTGGWWYTHDFRGRGGSRPTPNQILETIKNAKDACGSQVQQEGRYNRVVY